MTRLLSSKKAACAAAGKAGPACNNRRKAANGLKVGVPVITVTEYLFNTAFGDDHDAAAVILEQHQSVIDQFIDGLFAEAFFLGVEPGDIENLQPTRRQCSTGSRVNFSELAKDIPLDVRFAFTH
jgi:hypothetical protein